MNKITKIGILSFALVALLTSLITKAAGLSVIKEVSLTLTQGSNSCTIVDYAFGTKDASVNAIPLGTKTGTIQCTFLENGTGKVGLSLTNLSAGGNKIPYTGFQFKVNSATSVGAIPNLAEKTLTTFSNASISIYTKPQNKLGSWSSILTLSGTIPAGTPGGTYTGSLELTITEN